MRTRQRKFCLKVMAEFGRIPACRSMAEPAIGFSLVGKLAFMRIRVAVGACFAGSLEPFGMALRACNRLMLADQRVRCPGMIEHDGFPYRRRMTFIAASVFHKFHELPLMRIFMAGGAR